MKRSWFYGLAIAMTLFTANAYADPIETLSFSGTLGYGYDGSSFFGGTPSNGNIGGDAYSAAISFDPLKLTNDSCGTSSGTSCQWDGTFTEVLTITNDGTKYTQTFIGNGTIQYCAECSDDIDIEANGFSATFFDNTNAFFANVLNVNNPEDLLNFTNVSDSSGTWNGGDGSTSYGANPTTLSADLDPASVPEPSSLAIISAGLIGFGILRRRKSARLHGAA